MEATSLRLLVVTLLLCGEGCRRDDGPAGADGAPTRSQDDHPGPLSEGTKQSTVRSSAALADLYRDVTAESGIAFTYHNGFEADQYTILESLGGGVALFDYDGDGLLDVFLTGGGCFGGTEQKQIQGLGSRLYRNLGNWKFRDVTREAGVDGPLFYTHGCAVADYDRDGWPDLLVTGYGRMALYHNEPDGKGGRRFVDVTRAAGLPDNLWTTSAAWGDLDGDGYPDLFVCQYVDWSFTNNPVCKGSDPSIPRDLCGPDAFRGLPAKLFRNNGNGTFRDVSKEAGLRPFTGDARKDKEPGKQLGVVIADLNGDGKPDIYVANDGTGNFLYLNRSTPGRLRVDEVGLVSGVALDDQGVADGSMGVDVADYDGSGRASIWVTNYEDQLHSLFRNTGQGFFVYSTPAAGIGSLGSLYVGFGTAFLDVDNHGWEDLVVANGHVRRRSKRVPIRQNPVLLHNQGGKFMDVTRQAGDYFRRAHLGRGLAVGDLDNDGRPDLVISQLNDPVVVLRNDAGTGYHWLGIELAGKGRRDIAGAVLMVEAGGRRFTRYAKGGASYLSSGDRRLLIGLGNAERIDRVAVNW
ncbi:MAG: CRTAC1 family protein, partial [Planctomycetota bacterium]